MSRDGPVRGCYRGCFPTRRGGPHPGQVVPTPRAFRGPHGGSPWSYVLVGTQDHAGPGTPRLGSGVRSVPTAPGRVRCRQVQTCRTAPRVGGVGGVGAVGAVDGDVAAILSMDKPDRRVGRQVLARTTRMDASKGGTGDRGGDDQTTSHPLRVGCPERRRSLIVSTCTGRWLSHTHGQCPASHYT